MKKLIAAIVGSAAGMFVLDFVWLTTMAPRLYRPQLGDLLADDFRPGPAAVFYALYLLGVIYFAVFPALNNGGWRMSVLNGVLLGLVAYGTYDLTNQATLSRWPIVVTLTDLAWGSFLTAFSAFVGYQAARRFQA